MHPASGVVGGGWGGWPAGRFYTSRPPRYPLNELVMGGLALGKVGYGTWLRFVWPLLIVLILIYAIVLSLGVFVGI